MRFLSSGFYMNHLPPDPECPISCHFKFFGNSFTCSQLKLTTGVNNTGDKKGFNL